MFTLPLDGNYRSQRQCVGWKSEPQEGTARFPSFPQEDAWTRITTEVILLSCLYHFPLTAQPLREVNMNEAEEKWRNHQRKDRHGRQFPSLQGNSGDDQLKRRKGLFWLLALEVSVQNCSAPAALGPWCVVQLIMGRVLDHGDLFNPWKRRQKQRQRKRLGS